MKNIYLDNAATTPIDEQVMDLMIKVMRDCYGNPSSTHSSGQEAKALIEEVRRKIAAYLRVQPGEIIFTSCGTESNNLIIKSCVEHLGVERIITSPMEHKCVAESVRDMKNRKGIEAVYIRPNSKGDITLDQVEQALKSSDRKTLVTLMHANNEIGNIYDISSIGKLCRRYGAYFHSDTVQTIGHLDVDFSKTEIDFASCSAHKFHGPKGVGFAFVRKTSKLKCMISGGGQERDLRSGTENVPGIVGLGKALEISLENKDDYQSHTQEIKDYAITRLKEEIIGIKFNGWTSKEKSLYTLLSILLPFKDPMIGFKLDMKGIAVSQGSACSSGATKPSAVMLMLLDEEEMNNSTPLRVSFSHRTKKKDIDAFVEALVSVQPI
ncbi:MAG: cysteine desulfurase [Bergeyella sp.]|nr:cysteine desulfurase [Bergeyella sp.]